MNQAALMDKVQGIKGSLERMKSRCIAENRAPDRAEIQTARASTTRLDEIEKEFSKMDKKLALKAMQPYLERLERGEEISSDDRETLRELAIHIPKDEQPAILSRSQGQTYRPDPGSGGHYQPGGYQTGRNRDRMGFKSSGEELCALINEGKHDPRIAKIQAQQRIGEPSSGGFLTTPGFAADLEDQVIAASPMLSAARRYPMDSDTMKIAGADDRDHSGGIAGLEAAWLGEGSTLNPDKVIHRAIELNAKKLGILCKGSREYFRDGVSADAFIRDVMVKAATFYVDKALIKGSGAGQPVGLLSCSNLIAVSKQPGAVAQTFSWEDAVFMFERLTPNAQNAFWLISPSLKSQVLSMTIGIGTAGLGFWFQLRDATERGLSLLGLPVYWSEHCSYKGVKGDVILVNPGGYVVGMRQEVEIDLSPHLYFATDEIAIRLILRLDGQAAQSQALTLADGTHSVSDIITLEAR